MQKIKQRTHERRFFHAPITHSMYNRADHSKLFPIGYLDNYHGGIMGNISIGGMFFESDIPCRVNGPVYVNLLGDSHGLLVSNDTETLSGIVTWCRENVMDGHPYFRIGVRFDSLQPVEESFAPDIGAVWLS